jgi:eukaryotic-like serine/threonine-protein kinase
MISAMPPPYQRTEAVFVGRHDELVELRAGLEDAVTGRGRFFLVVGEAGIGKTRLVEELAREAAERGHLVLWGRCWEGEGAAPYWPWIQVIRASLRSAHGEGLPLVAGGAGAPYLAQLVPELGGLKSAAPSVPPQSEHARFYLFDAVATFLRSRPDQTPLVLVFDDLQWADTPSLLLLQFLVHELRDTAMLVVATYREMEARQSPHVADILGALARDGRHLPLRGFGEEEVALFIEGKTGRSASAALVRAVHRETEGNPFFVDEIVHLLVSEGALEHRDTSIPPRLPVPQGVREAIRRRLAPLPAPCRDALTLASVVGREFGLGALQRACGLGADALLEVLRPALGREILVRDPRTAGRYRFAHALIRETIYEDLGAAERARLHWRIGEALEALHQTDPTPHLATLAHHFLEAVPAGGAEKALTYGTRAARHAEASLAYEDAAVLLERALEVLAEAHPADARERCELLLARGGAQWKAGDGPGARETFRQAADIARRIGDAPLLARSALGFAGEGSRLLWVRSGVVDQPRIELLEEALGGLGDGDPGLRARLLARLAINLYWAPEPERVLALSEEAITLARQLGDPRDLAAVLRARWVALWRPETAEERLAIADEIVRLGEQTADRELALLGRRFRIVGFLEHGDVLAADREIEAWAQIAGELRQPRYLTDLAMWRATRAIMDGRFAEGEEHAGRALELGEREPEVEPAMRHAVQMSVLQFHRGHLEHAIGAAAPRSYAPAAMLLRCHRIFSWSETGRTAEARRDLRALAKDGFELPRDGGWLVYMSLLAAVAAELNDRESAARLYDLLLPYAGRLGIVGAGLACWGSISSYLGLLASALDRVADATRHFEDAAKVHERIGARPFLAWTQLAHARLLLKGDAGARRSEATALLTSALATARELGMDGLVAKIRGLGLESAATVGGEEPADGDAVFRNEGDFWTVAYAGKGVRLRHGKGLGDIAILLANPGKEIHVADLIAASASAPPDPRSTPTAELVAQGLRVSRGVSGDAVLDRRARADCRERLAELHRELEDAERCNDEGRVARARAELDFIAGELASAFGLGGRGRRAGSPIERARKAVASRIRFSLGRIARVHPALAHHLRRYIRTGTICTYVVPDEPVRWSV